MKMLYTNFLLVTFLCYSQQLPGGWQRLVVSDSRVDGAAKFAAQIISKSMESTYALKVIRAESIYFQIVAGTNYKMVVDAGFTSCVQGTQYELSKCPWNTKLVGNSAVKCNVSVYFDLKGTYHLSKWNCQSLPLEEALGGRMDGPLNLGGWELVKTDQHNVQEASRFAVKMLSEETDSKYYLKNIKVTSAERQVVAGMNYRITLIAGFTVCIKTQRLSSLVDCKYNTEKNVAFKCHLEVYRNLEDDFSLTTKSCSTEHLSSVLKDLSIVNETPTKWLSLPKSEYHVKVVAKEAIKILSKESHSQYEMMFSDVLRARNQVVHGGVRYRMVIEFGDSDCLKIDYSTAPELCSFRQEKERRKCDVNLMYIPWLFKVENVEVKNCLTVSVS